MGERFEKVHMLTPASKRLIKHFLHLDRLSLGASNENAAVCGTFIVFYSVYEAWPGKLHPKPAALCSRDGGRYLVILLCLPYVYDAEVW